MSAWSSTTGLPIDDIRSESEESFDEAEHPNDMDQYELGDVAGEESDAEDLEEGSRRAEEIAAEELHQRLSTLEEAEERASVRIVPK